MKISLIVILVIVLFNLSGDLSAQEVNSNCAILESLLKSEKIQGLFFLNKYNDLPIVFVDSKHIIGDCSIAKHMERVVQVVHDSVYLNEKGVQFIIIEKIKKKKRSFILTISHKDTGAAGDVFFKKRNREIRVSKVQIGYY